jgi:hypothetical protein
MPMNSKHTYLCSLNNHKKGKNTDSMTAHFCSKHIYMAGAAVKVLFSDILNENIIIHGCQTLVGRSGY